MPLTEAQLEARKGKLTASRIGCLMQGDRDKIMRLWLEMIGQEVEEDLSDCWPVRLGGATEELQLEWFERRNRMPVTRRGEVVVHPQYPWAACTLDGWCEELKCPIECKHVGGREPIEVILERYAAQCQWQMEITSATQCALSIICGASEPIVEYLDYDGSYAVEMIARGRQFMEFVRTRTPPVALDPVAAPVDATKVIDMTGSNQWANAAADWLVGHEIVDDVLAAEKVLKSLVPADCKKAYGYGVQITRNRANRLSLRVAT